MLCAWREVPAGCEHVHGPIWYLQDNAVDEQEPTPARPRQRLAQYMQVHLSALANRVAQGLLTYSSHGV